VYPKWLFDWLAFRRRQIIVSAGNGGFKRRFAPEIVNPYFEKPSKQERGGSFNVMFPSEGCAERRIRLSVPLEVSKLQ